MSNKILWDQVVGSGTIEDGGYIGKLLTLSRAHLDDARDKGQLSDSQVGEVYSNLIPSAIQYGMSFEFDEKIKQFEADTAETNARIARLSEDGAILDNENKEIEKNINSVKYRELKAIEPYDVAIKKAESKLAETKTSTAKSAEEGMILDNDIKDYSLKLEANRVKESELKVKMLSAEKDIDIDPVIIAAKKGIILNQGTESKSKAEVSMVEKLITDEKYVTIQEQNGKISYKYIYKYTYKDYAGLSHELVPNKVDSSGKIIQGYVDSSNNELDYKTVIETFDQYKDGNGEWKAVNTVGVNTTYSIVEEYYRMTLADGSLIDTNVSAFKNNQFAGKNCYVFVGPTGDTIMVEVGTNVLCDSGNLNSGMEALKTIDGNNRTSSDWDDLYTNGNDTIVSSYERVVYPSPYNVYNHTSVSSSRLGWNGIGTTPEYGMINSSKTLKYKINIDYSNVFSKTINGETGLGEDSMVQLEKKKLLTDIELSIDKLKLSKIPSTLK